jgi:hypothetical protein
VVLDEVDRLVEGVLCAETDDLDLVTVIASELLDDGSLPVADGSMRSPHP